MKTEISQALEKLVEVLKSLKVPFVLTGTTALDLLGVLPKNVSPADIDVRVSKGDLSEAQLKYLGSLEYISKGKQGDNAYKDSLEFYIGTLDEREKLVPVKVNVILVNGTQDFITLLWKGKELQVQPFKDLIKAKMELDRPKDKEFMLNLIKVMGANYNV